MRCKEGNIVISFMYIENIQRIKSINVQVLIIICQCHFYMYLQYSVHIYFSVSMFTNKYMYEIYDHIDGMDMRQIRIFKIQMNKPKPTFVRLFHLT